jgi:hypothetical protein
MNDSIIDCSSVTEKAIPSSSTTRDLRTEFSLGIFTKSHATFTPQGLQRFHSFLLQDQSSKLLPKERVVNCLKRRIDKTQLREVKYNQIRQKAHWANVQRCGSIWTCPVCSKQITEIRRSELAQGLQSWKTEHKGGVLLLTLTHSHTLKQALSDLLAGQRVAYKRFCENQRVIALLKSLGVQHKIRGLEVTYGANGWHVHLHVLLLTKDVFEDFSSIRDLLARLWIDCCSRSGLNAPSMRHGLDLRDGQYAEKYVSKWGLEHELTKGHIKKGRSGSYTPFDLLNFSLLNGVVNGRTTGSLWQEFGIAMKGQRQLVWSRGLKLLFQIAETTDEVAAQETEKQSISIRKVDNFLFSVLCTYQVRHLFLDCLANDYKDNCLGTGSAERLLIYLFEYDMKQILAGDNGVTEGAAARARACDCVPQRLSERT